MKRIHILAIVGLSLVAFLQITAVFAADYTIGTLTAAPSANQWTFSTITVPFEPSDINLQSIEATCIDGTTEYDPVPKKVLTQGDNVILIFSMADLPKHAESMTVTGELNSGETFEATGIGFAWGRR